MTDSDKSLGDKVVIVTGAGRGIGQAIATAYAGRGAKVVCAARSIDQLEETVGAIRRAGGEATALQTDVTDHGQVKRMVETTVKTYGGLDHLVANAGGTLDATRVADSKPENWVASVSLNLFAPYYCVREAIAPMKARGGGRMILVGSGNGHRGLPGNSSYAVAKAGMWMLVRVLAQELVAYNISVNELVPGPVNTFLTRDTFNNPQRSQPAGMDTEWIKEPADVVPLAMLLATHPEPGPTAQSFSLMRRDV